MIKSIFRLTFFLIFIAVVNSLVSCGSSKLSNDCDFVNDSNYYVYEIIDRGKSGKLSDREIINLKKKLVNSISTSIRSKAVTQGKIVNEVGQSYFGTETQSVSVGFLTNTNVIYCKRGRDYIAALSVNKRNFMINAMSQYENELRVNLQKVNSALINYDPNKKTFNKDQARLFSDKVQEIEALHGLVVIPDNYREEDINQFNDNLAQLSSMATEFSKRSYVFDEEKREIEILINTKDFKSAYYKISSLSKTYGENSREGLDLNILMDELVDKVRTNWDQNKRLLIEQFKLENFSGVTRYLNVIKDLTIDKSYEVQYEELYQQAQKLYKRIEKKRLLAESKKNQEIFFGVNATSSYGNVINDENTIALDESASNFNFDRFLPSYKLGYRLFFNPDKNFGIMMNVRGHSFKSIEITDSDYVFPFNENFTEIQAGISFSVFELSVGRFLEKSEISEEGFLKTLSLNMSLLTTDKKNKGEKNYINLYGGLNMISDFKDLTYLNINLGLNYHIRFNRKLSKANKIYLRSL